MNSTLAHDIDSKIRTDDVNIINNVDFTAMLLSDKVLDGLLTNGFKKPSPIQLKAIPMGRCGYDLIIQAKSGTGKTAVFGIIALEMIDVSKNQIQVLILAPTREIAVQIQDVIKTIGMNIEGLKVEYFIGGMPLKDDVLKLKNCHVAVGAPGRIKHLIKDGHMKVDAVKLFVLDEVDKLLTCTQNKDINFIYKKLNDNKQVIASSATYTEDLKKTLVNYMQTPTVIDPSQDVPVLLGIRQFVSTVSSHLNVVQQMTIKTNELIRIFQNVSFSQCMLFCNYQSRAETLSNNLCREGWPSIHISAAQDQKTRLASITCLKEFKCRILTTTDLTARGIDAANVDLVINFEIPVDSEVYLHRMGRAGRYGSNGLCITIITEGAEMEKFQNIINKIGSKIPVMKFPKEKIPTDIWTCDPEQFEKFADNRNDPENICNTLKELSFKQESETCIESIIQLIENKNEHGIENDVKILLSNIETKDEISKESCKNKLSNINPIALIDMMSRGESVIDNNEIIENIQASKSSDDRTDVQETQACLQKDEIKNESNPIVPLDDNSDLSVKISRCKKVKHYENKSRSSGSNDNEENNEKFETEAKLFQENSIVHKNIALYNVTKVIVEDSITEENIESTQKLLNIIEQEDNLEIQERKSKLLLADVLNQLGLQFEQTFASIPEDKILSLDSWQAVGDVSQNISINKCSCPENLLSEVFDYAISKTDHDWINKICDFHKNINEQPENTEYCEDSEEYYDSVEYCYEEEEYIDEESFEENYEENCDYGNYEEGNCGEESYEENCDAENCVEENEGMDVEVVFDDDVFGKAYDYALRNQIEDCEETDETNLEESTENEACGYAASYSYEHLKTRKRKRIKKNKQKNEAPKNDPNSRYESYFEYYNHILAQYGPYFTDLTEFETWFKQWQDNVSNTRNKIQEEIYTKEKLNSIK